MASPAASEVILDRPIHDTGSALYVILSFLLPFLGLPAAIIFRRRNYIRNFKACRKGVTAFLIVVAALVAILGLLLLMAVV